MSNIKNFTLIVLLFVYPIWGFCQHWQKLGSGLNGEVKCFYNDSTTNALYVGGNFNISGGITTWGLAKWNGLAWDSVGSGALDMQNCWPIFSIIRYKGELYVGGMGDGTKGGIEKWNGTNWELVGNGVNGSVFNFYIHNDLLYVCGEFDSVGNIAANSLATWDGNVWSNVHFIPNYEISGFFSIIYCVVFYNNELIVGGNLNGDANEIIKWNGITWETVGGGFYGNSAEVSRLIVYKNLLFAAGTFSKSDDLNNIGNYIVAWDGNNWLDVGGGMQGVGNNNGQIHDLIIYNDELYACGVFCYAGGIPAQYIAKWDGNNWCGLGSYFNNTLISFGVYQDMLYIGGGFRTINGDSINYVAKWTGGSYIDTCGNTSGIVPNDNQNDIIRVYPNPAEDILFIDGLTNPAMVSIYDISGKLIMIKQLTTDEIDISSLAKGMYFIKVISDKQSLVRKFLKE